MATREARSVPQRATGFDAVWREHAATVARVAAVLFDDTRPEDRPDIEALVGRVRVRAAAQWLTADPDQATWLKGLATGEFLGHGLKVYEPALHRMLASQVWSEEIVEELVQGAAARAAERLGELVERPRPLFGWLCQLARQQRVDWLRARSALKRDAARTVSLEGAPRLADTGTTPTQAERRTRVREMFDRVLSELTPEYAAVLRMHTDEHLAPAEIAARLRIQPGDARIRLFRARRRAAQVWAQLFPAAAADLAALGVFAADSSGPPKHE
jgi:RNA polymerase sigma factor (sigma-70 family)